MKLYFAILAALFVAPAAGAIGYISNGNDIPAFGDYLLNEQDVKHVPGQDSDDWLAVAVTGPNKGGALDLFQALATYPNHAALEQSAQGKVIYVEMKCENYSTDATKAVYSAKNLVRKCSTARKTRKQAEDYMVTLIAPSPKS
jgi:hypothetical protein